jgi:cell division protein FtsB
MEDMKEITKLEEENKNLKEENEDLKKKLQEWLDYINRHNY